MSDPALLREKLDAGRAAMVASLRALADDLERLPVRDAGEVLAWLVPRLERSRHETDRTFGRDRGAEVVRPQVAKLIIEAPKEPPPRSE